MLDVCLSLEYDNARIDTAFTAPSGTGLALMGASGSGKSSILNAIAGFVNPSQRQAQYTRQNRIRFNGQALDALPPAERPLTILFQSNNLFMHLSAWQNIAIGLNPKLKLTRAQKHAVSSALEEVGLGGFDKRQPASLSGGQQQRVALARCLVRNQPLLLLDEPFNGLDTPRHHALRALIQRIQKERTLTLLLATHQKDDADALCEQIVDIQSTPKA